MDYILFDKIIQLTIVDDPKFIDGMHYLWKFLFGTVVIRQNTTSKELKTI